MALTKEKVVSETTVSENGTVIYEERTNIIEDGKLLTSSVHRTSLTPSNELPIAPDSVVAICKLTWTKSVVNAYLESQK